MENKLTALIRIALAILIFVCVLSFIALVTLDCHVILLINMCQNRNDTARFNIKRISNIQ